MNNVLIGIVLLILVCVLVIGFSKAFLLIGFAKTIFMIGASFACGYLIGKFHK